MTTAPEEDSDLRRRVDALASAVIDGRISPAEQEELARLLSAHAAARDAFLQQLGVEALLRGQEYRVGEASAARSRSTRAVAPGSGAQGQDARAKGPWRKIAMFFALAASLAVAVGLGLTASRRPTQTLKSIQRLAKIVRTEQAEWGDERQALLPNLGIGVGRLSLKRGTAYLSTALDVELTLAGPCLVEFLDAKAVKVHDGRVTAKVNSDAAVGFRVLTPTVDLVDMGTEFGVLVEQDGSSEVHVFQGVVVARALGAEQVVPIYRDEAGRVAAEPKSGRDVEQSHVFHPTALVAVAARPDLFGQRPSIDPPSKSLAQTQAPLPPEARVLFIGDPYLDADTPLQLLEQAWHDSGWSPAPRLINGFVPDSIRQYTERIQHHVLRFRPTHVVVSFGPQNAMWPPDRIAPEQFSKDLAALVDRLTLENIEPILATSYRVRSAQAEAQGILDQYNDRVRDLAGQRGLRLADIDRQFQNAAGPLDALVDARGQAASFAASQLIVSALLESLGQREIPVPGRLVLRLLPGVITDWRFTLLPNDGQPLNSETARQISPDKTWTRLHLPQDDRFTPRLGEPSHSPLYRERACGFATNLSTGNLPCVRAITAVHSSSARTAYLHVGGGANLTVWLNGENVFDEKVAAFPAGHGHHPGYETVPIGLKTGDNSLLVECKGWFFLSITDSDDPPRREL